MNFNERRSLKGENRAYELEIFQTGKGKGVTLTGV